MKENKMNIIDELIECECIEDVVKLINRDHCPETAATSAKLAHLAVHLQLGKGEGRKPISHSFILILEYLCEYLKDSARAR